MSVEEQIRTIVKDELSTQMDELEMRFKATIKKENRQLREDVHKISGQLETFVAQLEELQARIGKLEEELNNRWSLVVKLRKYTLDQLMSEYKRLTGQMRPEQEESVENAEI
jgi:chromosome segregation ATPase